MEFVVKIHGLNYSIKKRGASAPLLKIKKHVDTVQHTKPLVTFKST